MYKRQACFCIGSAGVVNAAPRGASFVPGVLCAGAATSQEVRAAAPSVASCAAAQNWRRPAQKLPIKPNPHARHLRRVTGNGSPRGLAGAGRRVLNILGGSAPGFCARCAPAVELPVVARPPTGARACIETRRARIALPRRRHAAYLATELVSHLLQAAPPPSISASGRTNPSAARRRRCDGL